MNSDLYNRGWLAAKLGLVTCPFSENEDLDNFIDWMTGFNDYLENQTPLS